MKAAGKKSVKVVPGLVVRIPMEQGKFAYARVNKDDGLSIFDFIDDGNVDFQKLIDSPIAFSRYATHVAIKKGEWEVIGSVEFTDENDGWTPGQATGYFPDLGINKPHIYYRGKDIPAKLEDILGLDKFIVSQRPELLIAVINNRLIKRVSDLSRYIQTLEE
jgi:Immunity protein 26